MKNNKSIKKSSWLKTGYILFSLFWSILIILLLQWTLLDTKEKTTALTLTQARSFFTQLVTTRLWNSQHGGVYVHVTEKTQPNPYLDVPYRDIITVKGETLTLINPAYMTRQIAEIASLQDQIHFHITSLNPIRPANAPLEWEAEALQGFLKKEDEYYEWRESPGPDKNISFRFIAPLVTEDSCLQCHAKQGYAKGDVRGGISVSIPANRIITTRDKHSFCVLFSYLAIWILGMTGIFFTFRMIEKEYKKRSQLIDELQKTLNEVKTLKGFIPICASCKKVRNDSGYWDQIELYLKDHSDIEFTHGICPDCMKKLYPEVYREKYKE